MDFFYRICFLAKHGKGRVFLSTVLIINGGAIIYQKICGTPILIQVNHKMPNNDQSVNYLKKSPIVENGFYSEMLAKRVNPPF